MSHPPRDPQTALLVIDVQDSFKVGARWLQRNNPAFERNVERLVAGCRTAGVPIYYFLDSDDDEPFQPASPHFKLMDFLDPREEEPVIVKTSRNCFSSTNLDWTLRRAGISRVIVCGIKTEQCCETTARVASDLGYGVDYVIEATLTFPIPDPRTGDVLPVDEVVRRTRFVLHDRFAQVVTVDQALAHLGQRARSAQDELPAT